MDSNKTVRETTNDAAKTVREDGAQKTVRESTSGSSAPASIGLQTFRDYNIVEQLTSSGAESDIYVVSKDTDKFILKLYRFGIEPKIEIINKIVSLSKANPRELIHVFEFDFDEGTKRWFEIQEYAEHGSLRKLIDDIPKLGERGQNAIFLSILRQISDSLKLLHENEILHLDLKPANILVRSLEPVDIILIDFGISGGLDSDLSKRFTAVRGTPAYQSPESWIGAVGNPSDWWSLGMLMLEIANGKHLFEGLSQQTISFQLTNEKIKIPENISPDKKKLLRGLLTRNMSKRWGYGQVSRWLDGADDITDYFDEPVEGAPTAQEQTQNENIRPLPFLGEKHTSLDTLARAIAKDEDSWAKGRELLMRGTVRTWLEGNIEFVELAIEVDLLVEDAQDPDEKLFRFVHSYGKPLPFVFMGKAITFNNLYLFLGKNLRREEQSKSETAVTKKFCDGKLSSLLDFYLRHNESNDEFAGLKDIFSRIQGKNPQDIFKYLNAIYSIQKNTPSENPHDEHGHFRKAMELYDEGIKRRIAKEKQREDERERQKQERIAEEKRRERERIAEEKRKDDERLAEAKRNLPKILERNAKFHGCVYAGGGVYNYTIGLKADGTVVVSGCYSSTMLSGGRNIKSRYDVSNWWNIISVSGGNSHIVGLKTDGTVIASGDNKYGQCNVDGWRYVVSVTAGSYHTVGLKADGSVVATGENKHGECNVGDWRDIVSVYAGTEHTVGLKADGSVVAAGENKHGECNVGDWRDIVSVSMGSYKYSGFTVGLKSDGTVVAVGYNESNRCNTKNWQDIIAISTGTDHTVGLKADGTVVVVGGNYDGKCNTEDWRDIVMVSAGRNNGSSHTVGLKSDGTVVAVGYNEYGQCNVGGWRDIVAISTGNSHTVGLKSDGTVVAVGYKEHDQCNVSYWRNIGSASISKEQLKNRILWKSQGLCENCGSEKIGLIFKKCKSGCK